MLPRWHVVAAGHSLCLLPARPRASQMFVGGCGIEGAGSATREMQPWRPGDLRQ